MTDRAFRIYDPTTVGLDGYPREWHDLGGGVGGVKDLVRFDAAYRCLRCQHPYASGAGEWSGCDERCTHGGPYRFRLIGTEEWAHSLPAPAYKPAEVGLLTRDYEIQSRWRILTVHHLNGVKWDLRWWNLVALCQRCHLEIQAKVVMERAFIFEHSDWFRPYAAGFYATKYLGEDLDRAQTMERLDELLGLERLA